MEEKTKLDEVLIQLKRNNILLHGVYGLLAVIGYDSVDKANKKQIELICDTVNNTIRELTDKNK